MNSNNSNINEGLILTGKVTQRSKKFIGEDKKEVVTYLVSTENGHYFLDEFLPRDYFHIDDEITVPVNCRPFVSRNGKLGVSFTIRKNNEISLSGEEF